MNCFVLYNKKIGDTSFYALKKLHKIFDKKIGHNGTLDPLATGLLVIGVNKAAKFLNYLPSNKTYEFTIQFGLKTESADLDGKIIEKNEKFPTYEELLNIINDFQGEIKQTPNKFSAIKIDGQKAYEMARKNIEFIMPERIVEIFSLKLLHYENKYASLEVCCSKGLYVRSLTEQIAEKLQCIGCVVALKRTGNGIFHLNEIENEYKIVDLSIFNQIYPIIKINLLDEKKILNGVDVFSNLVDGIYAAQDETTNFIGLIECKRGIIFRLCMIK